MVGMAALKDECKETAKKQSALMRSDMDQIMSSRAFLESKLRGTDTEWCNNSFVFSMRRLGSLLIQLH